MDATISVIVPIYNTKQYLPRCIESILSQTYTNIELLLINDGSTDGCTEICDSYAKKDSRIAVIHKENTGQSDSQNLALTLIKGEFVTFVDSDDYMMPTMLQTLWDMIKTNDADIAVCAYLRDGHPDTNKATDGFVLTNIQAMSDIFTSGGKINPETWAKLYKKSLFLENNICFPAGHTAGDQHTTYKLMYYARKIAVTNQRLFRYMHRADSITGVSFKPERLYVLTAGESAMKFVKEKNIPLEQQARCFYVGLCLYQINQILKDGSYHKWSDVLTNLRKLVLSHYTSDMRTLLAKKRLVGICLLRLGYWAYKPMCMLFLKFLKG